MDNNFHRFTFAYGLMIGFLACFIIFIYSKPIKSDTIERELFIKRFNADGTLVGYNLSNYTYEASLKPKLAFIQAQQARALVTIKEGKIIKVEIGVLKFVW